MNTEYATTEELNYFMVMIGEIPNPQIVSDDRLLETVGTGDGSTTRFTIDHSFIVADSYTFYYGATESAALSQQLTETTHYTIDKDSGILTLTTEGVTLVGVNNIYSAYKYNLLGFKDSDLQAVLNRMDSYITKKTHRVWTDGSVETPEYHQVVDETHDGKGSYGRRYFANHRPLTNISTQLNGAVAVSDTTITVDSTNGFPSSGVLGIGASKIEYSGKTSNTFTGCTGVNAILADNSPVYPYVFEASNSVDGVSPTWTILERYSGYDIDFDNGRIYLSNTSFNPSNALSFNIQPPLRIPNRFRMTYLYGEPIIPEDVTQLTLMLSAKELLHRAVRKAHINGLNDFDPSLINIDDAWINDLIKEYYLTNIGVSN